MSTETGHTPAENTADAHEASVTPPAVTGASATAPIADEDPQVAPSKIGGEPEISPVTSELAQLPLVVPEDEESPIEAAESSKPSEESSASTWEDLDPESSSHFRFFAPTSVFNTTMPANAPIDPESSQVVQALDSLVRSELAARTGPAINTTAYTVALYTVPASQPSVPVELESPYRATALREAFAAVPIPPDAKGSRGNDAHIVIWQPSTDRLWEFWHFHHTSSGWAAAWGGAIQNVSTASGVYGNESWPGATSMWGASASSLSIAGGLITFEDLRNGRIDHALEMSVPNVRAGVYAAPAQRGDGESTEPFSLPEGAHLRLDPNLELSRLHLPRLTMMMAEAAQTYGIIVRDGARNVTFNAQEPEGSINPYIGPGGFWEGSWPQQFLSAFPWSQLQLLKMELHPTAR